jgi:hypothetical protein
VSARFAREREVAAVVWKRKGLWVIHLIANAAILVGIYQWLWIPDRTALHLALSALSGAALLALALWLHGSTLAHFGAAHARQESALAQAFRQTLGTLAGFALWAVLLTVVILLCLQLHAFREGAATWTASFLTLRLRRPVSPSGVSAAFRWGIVLLAAVAVPAALMPWGCNIARNGLRGLLTRSLRPSGRSLRRFRYWMGFAVLCVAGGVIPYQLVWWVPEVDGLGLETASVLARFGIAYVFAVTAWLCLVSYVAAWSCSEQK